MKVLKIVLIGLNVFLVAAIVRCVVSDSLHRQCALGDTQRVAALVARGADVDLKVQGMTPLVLAVQQGHLDVVRLLVEAGADVNLREQYTGMTPLEAALDREDEEMADYLIEHGAASTLR